MREEMDEAIQARDWMACDMLDAERVNWDQECHDLIAKVDS